MNNSRELGTRLQKYEAQLKSLNSFIKALNDRTAEHDTPSDRFEVDLLEAEHNAKYYEEEIARIKELIEESSGLSYFVYEDSSGEWRWRLRAANNRIIAESGEGYHNRQDCLHAIALVKESAHAPVKDRE